MRAVMAAQWESYNAQARLAPAAGSSSRLAMQQRLRSERRMDVLETKLADLEKRLDGMKLQVGQIDTVMGEVAGLRELCTAQVHVSAAEVEPAVSRAVAAEAQACEIQQAQSADVAPGPSSKPARTRRRRAANAEDGARATAQAEGSEQKGVDTDLLLGRYRLVDCPPLGSGGWCVVRRADDLLAEAKELRSVAVKTYGPQAVREMDRRALAARFRQEIGIFGKLSLDCKDRTNPVATAGDPRWHLVNLLDFSEEGGEPGAAADGQYYTVLELAEHSLPDLLAGRRGAKDFLKLDELREIMRALLSSLSCLHDRGYSHLDVKPDNIMRFQGVWKLIDLEGCRSALHAEEVQQDGITPLYASPEIARYALDPNSELGLVATEKMDIWAAGVVLLDLLAHGAALEETKASFDAYALFEEEAVPHGGWYEWLASPEQLNIDAVVSESPSSVQLLQEVPALREALQQMLNKDPDHRPRANVLLAHPFFESP